MLSSNLMKNVSFNIFRPIIAQNSIIRQFSTIFHKISSSSSALRNRSSFHNPGRLFCSTSSSTTTTKPIKPSIDFDRSKPSRSIDSESTASSTTNPNISKRGPKFRTPSKMQDASSKVFDGGNDDNDRLDWNVWAYATADDYRMELMGRNLRQENAYRVNAVAKDLPNVFRLTPRTSDDDDSDRREIFVFSDGAVVFWDVPLAERQQFLRRLRPFEQKPYDLSLVRDECERLVYVLRDYSQDTEDDVNDEIRPGRFRKEVLHLDAAGKQDDPRQLLERYAVSNVMSASVQLSMWESDFENMASTLEGVTEAMNKGTISLRKKRAITYAGRLTSLRHNVNLHSDLLDHPDFYWEREGLAKLYDQASEVLCIRRRVNVLNKKLDDAMALIQLIMQELTVTHSSRLEWLIIYLICLEVIFDAFHLWKTW